MKKVLSILLLLLMLIPALSACAKAPEKTAAAAETETAAATETVTAAPAVSEAAEDQPLTLDLTDDEQLVENQIIDKPLTVTGSFGTVNFTNCEFRAKVTLKGGEGAVVRLWEGCTVAEGVTFEINSQVLEATLETDLPKFMFFCESVPSVTLVNSGAVVAAADTVIRVNNGEHPIEEADTFLDMAAGEAVPYAGQEAEYHNFSLWFEGGEPVTAHYAIREGE